LDAGYSQLASDVIVIATKPFNIIADILVSSLHFTISEAKLREPCSAVGLDTKELDTFDSSIYLMSCIGI